MTKLVYFNAANYFDYFRGHLLRLQRGEKNFLPPEIFNQNPSAITVRCINENNSACVLRVHIKDPKCYFPIGTESGKCFCYPPLGPVNALCDFSQAVILLRPLLVTFPTHALIQEWVQFTSTHSGWRQV